MKNALQEIIAVLYKEILSEFRTRYSITTILLFILTTITIIAISFASEILSQEATSSLLWIVIFFGTMIGLSKSFINEEERGTSLLLGITVRASSNFFGKLIYNILLSLFINFFSIVFFFLFVNTAHIVSIGLFIIIIIICSIAIASATTVISAIISKASSKNALFPILSFPILLPIIKIGIDSTGLTMQGTKFSAIQSDMQLIIAYTGLLIIASYLLFDFIWKD
ncbi:MAG TPA: heme exporter protein CcmB [Candidatus Kapabacteria bacterium]|nr:heme exporter protein CcmB [Candidatus Kapabacteria bacterium]